MAYDKTCTALIDLPAGHAQQALKAGLAAMNVVASVLPHKGRRRFDALAAILTRTDAVAFVDISDHAPSLMELDKQLPMGSWRERIFLTRLKHGHVSQGDRRWALKLGFGGFWSDFDARDLEGDLGEAIDATAMVLDLTPLSPSSLKRYAGVAVHDATNVARETIRVSTGMKAEVLVTTLARQLSIKERSYHLHDYPSCFVGSEAVAWLIQHFACDTQSAVAVGDALAQMGLLMHVTHERPFENANYFYRLATSKRADRVNLGEALHVLRRQGGIAVMNRSHLGRDYATCWVGSEAVDLLSGHFELKRHQAWVLGHRMMQFGLLEHVVQQRPFIDGNFYYRFADDAARLKAQAPMPSESAPLAMTPKLAR